jgi:hypothetical protein
VCGPSWQHEYFYSSLPIEARFASGAGSESTVNGPTEGHDAALIDAARRDGGSFSSYPPSNPHGLNHTSNLATESSISLLRGAVSGNDHFQHLLT